MEAIGKTARRRDESRFDLAPNTATSLTLPRMSTRNRPASGTRLIGQSNAIQAYDREARSTTLPDVNTHMINDSHEQIKAGIPVSFMHGKKIAVQG